MRTRALVTTTLTTTTTHMTPPATRRQCRDATTPAPEIQLQKTHPKNPIANFWRQRRNHHKRVLDF